MPFESRLVSVFVSLILLATPVLAAAAKDTGSVTFSEDVAPILFENCVSCHRPGQIGPMSLLSYDEARPWAKSIRRVTAEGTMPPWFASPEHGQFKNDPSLSPDEVEILARWAATGAKKGDPAAMPEVPSFESTWQIGKPDVVFTMEPFEVTDEMEDHYQWMAITNHLEEDRWIKAVEVRPTFSEGAHHNLTFVVPEGQGPEALGDDRDLLVGWAPGTPPFYFEEGYGKLLPAKSTILFQMHYHKDPGPGTGGIDQTSVAMKFYDQPVENPVTTMWILDPALDIPPGASDYASESYFTFEDDGTIFQMTPHMHLRGKSMRYVAQYPDGREEVILDVPEYDFNWQLNYMPMEPLRVPKGTTIRVTARFDNSADNPANPDPSATVRWGEATTDEMMIGFLEYAYDHVKEGRPTAAVPEHLREMLRQRRQELEREIAAPSEGGL